MQGLAGSLGQLPELFILGVLIFILDVEPRGDAAAVERLPGMVARGEVRVIAVVHADVVVARQVAAVLARLVQVEAVLALRDALAEGIDTVVGAVEVDLAHAGAGHPVHPGPRQLEAEHVANHRLVAPWGNESPLVVLLHAQDFYFLLCPAIVGQQVTLQGAEGQRLLVRLVERRVAAVLQGDVALVVDGLPGVGHGVGIVQLSVAVVYDLHARQHVVITPYHAPVDGDEHDGQVGLRHPHVAVAQQTAVVVARLRPCRGGGKGQRYGQGCRVPKSGIYNIHYYLYLVLPPRESC